MGWITFSVRDWFRPVQCLMVGHDDRKTAGRLDQVVCLRCGRKNPPDTTAEDIRQWNAERGASQPKDTPHG